MINEMFQIAIEHRDLDRPTEAINELHQIILLYPEHPKIAGIYTVLAGIYKDIGDYNNAVTFFQKAILANPNSELASLGLYVSLVKSGDYGAAIVELKRYLEDHSANLYKDTLAEIMEDVESGYATKYKEEIFLIARRNGLI